MSIDLYIKGSIISVAVLIVSLCSLLVYFVFKLKRVTEAQGRDLQKHGQVISQLAREGSGALGDAEGLLGGALPAAIYSLKRTSPEGMLVSEASFSCTGETLAEAIRGVKTLKGLAEGEGKAGSKGQEEDGGKDSGLNYCG